MRYRGELGLAAEARMADPDVGDDLTAEMVGLDLAPGTDVVVVGHDDDRGLVLVEWTDAQGNPRTTSIEPDVFDRDFEE